MNIKELDAAAGAACELLKSMASPIRLKILCQLVEGEKSVGEIARIIGARDTVISQHLALLRRDGMVANRRDAQTIYYSIASPSAMQVLKVLHQVFCSGEAPSN